MPTGKRIKRHRVLPAVFLWLCGVCCVAAPATAQDASAAASAATASLALADDSLRRALALANEDDYGEALRRQPDLRNQLESARRFLNYARSGLETANSRPSAAAYQDVKVLAERAQKGLDDYRAAMRAAFSQLEVERRPPPPPPSPPPPPPEPEPEPEPAPVESAPADNPTPAPTADSTSQDVTPGGGTPESTAPESSDPENSNSESAAADSASGAAAAAETKPAAAPAEASAPPQGGRAAKAPASLRRAVGAYLDGDYQAVVDGLDPQKLRRGSRRGQALLLRAASRFALFLLGGETDYSLRGTAADDIIAARAAAPDVEPAEGVFSPRFRDFFVATR